MTKTDEIKICPMLAIASTIGELGREACHCLEDDCGWFSTASEECSMVTLADESIDIRDALLDR